MVQNTTQPDVVVIGAGAAGIGAGLALRRLGVSAVILEAKQRVGGRAYSDESSLGHLWDHGCHWFHSADRNVLRTLADRVGHAYLAAPRYNTVASFTDGRWHKTSLRESYVWDMLDTIAAAGAGGRDIAAEDLLDRSHRYYPLIRHWCQLMYSHDPENLSTGDAGAYSDSRVNLPVEAGYGALVARLAAGLDIRLDTPATRVEATRDGVAVVTRHGTVTARACVLAVPARILERRQIDIVPALPESLAAALDDVPMGHYEKIAIAFDGRVFDDPDIAFADIFDPASPPTRPLNFELHPFGRPIAVTHVGGSTARELAEEGEAAMTEFAIGALVRAYGSALRRRITRTAVTRWTEDPFIGGAYSGARPGRAKMRAAFAEPVHDRIFLAGEHVHRTFMATCHGAYETGIAAGHRAAEAAGFRAAKPDPLWLPAQDRGQAG